jgi:hypothetical protein
LTGYKNPFFDLFFNCQIIWIITGTQLDHVKSVTEKLKAILPHYAVSVKKFGTRNLFVHVVCIDPSNNFFFDFAKMVDKIDF